MWTSIILLVDGTPGLIWKCSDKFTEGTSGSPCLNEIKYMYSHLQLTHYEEIYVWEIRLFCFISFYKNIINGKCHKVFSDNNNNMFHCGTDYCEDTAITILAYSRLLSVIIVHSYRHVIFLYFSPFTLLKTQFVTLYLVSYLGFFLEENKVKRFTEFRFNKS